MTAPNMQPIRWAWKQQGKPLSQACRQQELQAHVDLLAPQPGFTVVW